jgi:hypothetical protein
MMINKAISFLPVQKVGGVFFHFFETEVNLLLVSFLYKVKFDYCYRILDSDFTSVLGLCQS